MESIPYCCKIGNIPCTSEVQVFKVWKVLILKKKIAFIAFIEFIGFIAFIAFSALIKNNITKEWTNLLISINKGGIQQKG